MLATGFVIEILSRVQVHLAKAGAEALPELVGRLDHPVKVAGPGVAVPQIGFTIHANRLVDRGLVREGQEQNGERTERATENGEGQV